MDREEETTMLSTLRLSVLGGAAALGVVSVAVADMSGLVGNTLVEYDRQNPEIVIKVQLYADGSYQSWVSAGFKPITTQGTWKEQDGKLCYTQTSKPIPGRPTYFCAKGMDGKKVGDTWLRRDDDYGRWYKGRVVAGGQ
jgi:hypothetical protein